MERGHHNSNEENKRHLEVSVQNASAVDEFHASEDLRQDESKHACGCETARVLRERRRREQQVGKLLTWTGGPSIEKTGIT